MVVKIFWIDEKGEIRRYETKGPVYIGRLPKEIIKTLNVNSYDVFIIDESKDSKVYTGITDLFISRYHLLLKPEGDKLKIIDYGCEGRGSTNGTIILDIVQPSELEKKLKEVNNKYRRMFREMSVEEIAEKLPNVQILKGDSRDISNNECAIVYIGKNFFGICYE